MRLEGCWAESRQGRGKDERGEDEYGVYNELAEPPDNRRVRKAGLQETMWSGEKMASLGRLRRRHVGAMR